MHKKIINIGSKEKSSILGDTIFGFAPPEVDRGNQASLRSKKFEKCFAAHVTD